MSFSEYTCFQWFYYLSYIQKEENWVRLCVASFMLFKFTEHISGQCCGNTALGLQVNMLVVLTFFFFLTEVIQEVSGGRVHIMG